MPMHISIDIELASLILVHDGLLRRIDCGMSHWTRRVIHSIEIQTLSVIPPITSLHSIWIETWHDLKNKILKK